MSAREPSTRQLVTRGVAATAVIALVVAYTLVEMLRGGFGRNERARAL